jgi:hypothetical protein
MALLHREETKEEWRRRIFAKAEEFRRRHLSRIRRRFSPRCDASVNLFQGSQAD